MNTIYSKAALEPSRASTSCMMMTTEQLTVKLLQFARSLLRFPYRKSSPACQLLADAESRDGCSPPAMCKCLDRGRVVLMEVSHLIYRHTGRGKDLFDNVLLYN